jgi:hypothetical protein
LILISHFRHHMRRQSKCLCPFDQSVDMVTA